MNIIANKIQFKEKMNMKSYITISVILILLILLTACAGFPEAQKEGDSLVIGSLILNFTDNFFDKPPKIIKSGVKITVLNVTTNTKQELNTSNGFYKFATNGTDAYVLESYKYEESENSGTITVGPSKLYILIKNIENKIIYPGHIEIKYSYNAQSDIKNTGSAYTKTYDYDSKLSTTWDEDAIMNYIQKRDLKGSWTNCTIVRQGETLKL
jgi:hypothetical protein